MAWTSEQILALAPDAGSAKSGRELSAAHKWTSLGQHENSAWGLCQGSGKDPYQTRIDLNEPAFKCSCPSRKFPCKHSLGLFLLLAEQPKAFTSNKPPPWVQEWLDSRKQRSEKKAEKQQVQAANDVDPAVQAKRAAEQAKRAQSREQKVASGMEELERFLRDVVRQGIAQLATKAFSFWENAAARLVDAQAPGLARQVRDLAGIPVTGEGWQERVLERLARLYLVLEGYKRLSTLPPELQAELRAIVGFTVNQDEVQTLPGIGDEWQILGQRVTEEDRLRVQRSWLWGRKTQRAALILQFAHASQALDVSLMPGTAIGAELVYYPGSSQLRALIKKRESAVRPLPAIAGFTDFSAAFGAYAEILRRAPFIEQFPLAVESVVPERVGGRWRLVDRNRHEVAISEAHNEGWKLAALSGGKPVNVFGEWDSVHLMPLAASVEHRYVQL